MSTKKMIDCLNKMIASMKRMEEQEAAWRNRIKEQLPPGKYDGVTVYTVPETTVRKHVRKGYTAVRRNNIKK